MQNRVPAEPMFTSPQKIRTKSDCSKLSCSALCPSNLAIAITRDIRIRLRWWRKGPSEEKEPASHPSLLSFKMSNRMNDQCFPSAAPLTPLAPNSRIHLNLRIVKNLN